MTNQHECDDNCIKCECSEDCECTCDEICPCHSGEELPSFDLSLASNYLDSKEKQLEEEYDSLFCESCKEEDCDEDLCSLVERSESEIVESVNQNVEIQKEAINNIANELEVILKEIKSQEIDSKMVDEVLQEEQDAIEVKSTESKRLPNHSPVSQTSAKAKASFDRHGRRYAKYLLPRTRW